MYEGVDTSSNNNGGTGLVNFDAVRISGRAFAMVRVGYGLRSTSGFSGYISKSFVQQLKNAQAAGLDTGVYWYSRAVNEEQARIEADACLKAIAPYQLTYPVAFDQEYDGQIMALTRQKRTNICIAFLEEVRRQGYYPMMYASKDWYENWIYDSQLQKYDHWVAQYADRLTYQGETSIWQYSGSGSIPGVTGAIDLDVSYKDYPTIIREGGNNHLTPVGTDYKALYEAERARNRALISGMQSLIDQYQG